MANRTADAGASTSARDYNILGQPGYFTVNFTSPDNSLHQISGFKSEDDAQAWVAEAKLLIKTYF